MGAGSRSTGILLKRIDCFFAAKIALMVKDAIAALLMKITNQMTNRYL